MFETCEIVHPKACCKRVDETIVIISQSVKTGLRYVVHIITTAAHLTRGPIKLCEVFVSVNGLAKLHFWILLGNSVHF